jgi:hypothetical protein
MMEGNRAGHRAGDPVVERAQGALKEFLRTDLELAFIFLETAAIDVVDCPSHSLIALEKATVALETIRRFVSRVEDLVSRGDIEMRANKLESAIHELCVLARAHSG